MTQQLKDAVLAAEDWFNGFLGFLDSNEMDAPEGADELYKQLTVIGDEIRTEEDEAKAREQMIVARLVNNVEMAVNALVCHPDGFSYDIMVQSLTGIQEFIEDKIKSEHAMEEDTAEAEEDAAKVGHNVEVTILMDGKPFTVY